MRKRKLTAPNKPVIILPPAMTGSELKQLKMFDREKLTEISKQQSRQFRSGL